VTIPSSLLIVLTCLHNLLSTGSDGTAADEAAINGLIEHPLVVSAHGVFLSGSSPEGMVMELLEGADALGMVPSFVTVTRDSGPSASASYMNRAEVIGAIWNVATALEYVHSTAKVANGDVYLHNVLKCLDGTAKVSDWGASFVYDGIAGDDSHSRTFESIEVLAFGRLVQDLFDWHLDTALPDSTEPPEFSCRGRGAPLEAGRFFDLMSSILQPRQNERPSFSDIKAELSSIPDFAAVIDVTTRVTM
jgi:serine/threonine protein kinase